MKRISTIIVCIILLQTGLLAQQMPEPCGVDKATKALKANRPKNVKARVAIDKSATQKATPQYIIPIVVHVFGTDFGGYPVNDAVITEALNQVNIDFAGLNTDFNDVINYFKPLRSTMDLEFRLAKKDPNGNSTTGIIYHPDEGCGLGNWSGNSIIQQYAWDNYKYMNLYISYDLHCSGVYNSGVAWLPDVSMSNANTARVVYNGKYLWGNALDTEFQATLTHEVGHWLGLHHTFIGSCGTSDFDYGYWGSANNEYPPSPTNLDDTPKTTSTTSGCNNVEKCSGAGINNVSNYMDYSDCRRMYTIGQVDVMTWQLDNHPGRHALWQPANLVATGVNDPPIDDTQDPTAPTGLNASNITQSSVQLNWNASTDNVGVTEYIVYMGATIAQTVTGTSTSLTSLTSNTTYIFTVTAKDAAGNESAASNAVTVKTLVEECTEPPAAPTNLQGTNITASSVDLSWQEVMSPCMGETISYDVIQDGVVVKNVATTSMTVTGLSANTVYTFTIKAKDSAGNESAPSSEHTITTDKGSGCSYCTLSSTDQSYEWITGVTIGSYSKASAKENGGYSDFTSETINLTAGSGINVVLTPNNSQYTEYFKVWIDYNSNCVFEDSEMVFNGSAKGNTTGTIDIPSGVNVTTRMRIAMQYNKAPSLLCGTYQYGEVEDYTVNISGDFDTEAPTAPTGLNASNVTQTSLQLNWNASTDNVGVTEYVVYMRGSIAQTVSGTSASVTSLTANTTYTFTVTAKDAADNESAASNAITVTTDPENACEAGYCAFSGDDQGYEWITRVSIGSFTKTTGAESSGYGDYTSNVINLTAGAGVNLTLTPNNTRYAEYFKVWIDYNGDCDFEDSGEEVFSGNAKGNTTGTINVPSGASGTTRMRIAMQYNKTLTSTCGTFQYGEVEDYTVNISSAAKAALAQLEEKIEISPNPTNGIVKIETNKKGVYTINIIDSTGKIVKSFTRENNTTIDLSDLSAGMYFVNVDGVVEKLIKQ